MTAPLTKSQELFWTGQALAGEVPLYNQAWRFDFSGSLERGHVTAAFERLTERADVLRTVFRETEDGVVQDVLNTPPRSLEHVDLSPYANPDDKARAFIEARSRQPFDLDSATYDAVLLRLDDQRWVLFFSQHHIVTDAWSVALLFEAFRDHLESLRAGLSMPSEPLPAFQALVVEERTFRLSNESQEAAEHWRAIAEASAGPVRLYNRRNSDASPETVRIARPLTEAQVEGLASLSRADGVRSFSNHLTHFNLFLTTFFAYAARVSGQRQITIGTPAHNRTTPALKRLPGLLVEVFPFAAAIEEGETFRSLFGKVAAANMENMRFSRAGAASVESGRAFNVILNYINATFSEIDGLERRIEWLSTDAMDPGHDLRLHVMDMNGDGAPVLAFDLKTSTFPERLRLAIPDHFTAVLDAMLDNFDRQIDEVAIVSATERTAHLDTFNQVPLARGGGETVLSLFAKAVGSSPSKTAVTCGKTILTFEALDRWSDEIAAELARMGVGPGALVGLHMRRSAAYPAAVLGVMKVGAAFLPLDSSLPLERLAFTVDDADVAAIVTEPSLIHRLRGQSRPVLTINAPPAAKGRAVLPTTHAPMRADDSAYVIYTSGSTGQPKGVEVSHGAFASYLAWASAVYGGDEPVSMPFFTAIGFDLTLTSLFVPLISGGAIVVYPEPMEGSDLSVLDVFSDDHVDIVKLTPAHLALVTEHVGPARRIRTLVLGGEDLKTQLATNALDRLGHDVTIYNEYGPTEAVIGCMVHRFDPAEDRGLSVPIGVPADGMCICVLDSGMNPVPQGVAGEIYIGGNRLAKGYVGREDLTAERFIDDPFRQGERLYRTGDLARFNDRWQLDYLGRSDRQVKLRGVRIELGEIEQALKSLPDVSDAVIIAHSTDQGQRSWEKSAGEVHCTRCGLSSDYPDATIDAGVCSICRELEDYKDRAQVYFSDMSALRSILDDASTRSRGDYDCIALTSGGKDSIYALARLADMGPRILALTLDNGYLSDGAKDNISRVTRMLGVDHRYVSTPAMNAIFVDSLKRHANVCNGCFKTIYTLAVQTALEVGAPTIVTGLSRGQFFETRLTPDLFKSGPVTCGNIEAMVLEARKAYHRTDDAVSAFLDTEAFKDDTVFDQVQFVDFYRYCDVSLDEIYSFLHERLPWKRPDDTGRSSNCLINDVGIYVHKRREGFHNYALPYSWDVRMGHKDREAALDELNDDIDVARVRRILNDIGYDADDLFESSADTQLCAYVVSDRGMSASDVKASLKDRLPPEMMPARVIRIDAIPLTANGKVDVTALPASDGTPTVPSTIYRAPSSKKEILLAALWADVLRIERVGVDDNYYDLGGDSISAIRIAARARKDGIDLPPALIFQHQTVAELAAVVGVTDGEQVVPPDDHDPSPFTLAGLGTDSFDAIAAALGSSRKSGS
ncbi:MAG: amino acid adenylation domain-containing protein [Pseudomonadota bacterium]